MPTTMNCPGCRTPLRLRDDMAGMTIKCPRCGKVISLPAEEAVRFKEVSAAETVTIEPPASTTEKEVSATRLCPECGGPVDVRASRCRSCNSPQYKPCPRCGEEGAKRVAWTAWGSFYGPALFTHVRCPCCGYAYNGKSGRSNLVPAIIFVAVPLFLILGIIGALGWIMYHRGFF